MVVGFELLAAILISENLADDGVLVGLVFPIFEMEMGFAKAIFAAIFLVATSFGSKEERD